MEKLTTPTRVWSFADIESTDDVYNELLHDVPVKILNAAGGVKYEDDVTATVADNCG